MPTCKQCGEDDPDKFYPRRKNKCKKCVSADANNRYHNLSEIDKQAYKDRAGKWQDDNLFVYRLRSAQSRNDCSITENDLRQLWREQNGKCYYSGLDMVMERSDFKYSMSVERLDSTVGYHNGNVVLCCSAINRMKNKLSCDEFYDIVYAICEHSSQNHAGTV